MKNIAIAFMLSVAWMSSSSAQDEPVEDQVTAAKDAESTLTTIISDVASGETIVLAQPVKAKFMGDDYPIIGRAGFRVVDGELGPYVFVPCQGQMFEADQNMIEPFLHECPDLDEIPITILIGADTFSVAKKMPFLYGGEYWQGYVANMKSDGVEKWAATDSLSLIEAAKAAAQASGNPVPSQQQWDHVFAEVSTVGDQKYVWINSSPAGADVFQWAGFERDKPVFTVE